MRMIALVVLAFAACGIDTRDGAEVADVSLGMPEEGFQLDEGDFTIEPGQEGLYCMRMPIPERYGDDPVFVTRIESRLPVATHHFFMAYRPDPVAAATPCFESGPLVDADESEEHGDGGGKLLFTSGAGAYDYELPAGYAFYLKTGRGQLVTSHHVLNTGDEPRKMYGRFNVHTTKPDKITHPINKLNCLLQDIWVAPHSKATVSGTCTAPFDLDLVMLSSHAHQHLEKFTMTLRGEVIYESRDWDSPEIVTLSTPLRVSAGEGITFSCAFDNRGDEWVVFGTGDYGEMCAIMSGYAFPPDRPHEVPPSLGTIIYRDGASAPLLETEDLDGPF